MQLSICPAVTSFQLHATVNLSCCHIFPTSCNCQCVLLSHLSNLLQLSIYPAVTSFQLIATVNLSCCLIFPTSCNCQSVLLSHLSNLLQLSIYPAVTSFQLIATVNLSCCLFFPTSCNCQSVMLSHLSNFLKTVQLTFYLSDFNVNLLVLKLMEVHKCCYTNMHFANVFPEYFFNLYLKLLMGPCCYEPQEIVV